MIMHSLCRICAVSLLASLFAGESVWPGEADADFPIFIDERSDLWTREVNAVRPAGEVLKVEKSGDRDGVVFAFDFSGGASQWAGVWRNASLAESASAMTFQAEGTPEARFFAMIEGADEQRFTAEFTTAGEQGRQVVLPLNRQTFSRKLGGGDGILRFPLRSIGFFAAGGGVEKGRLALARFSIRSTQPEKELPCLLAIPASAFDNVFYPEEEKSLEVLVRNRSSRDVKGDLVLKGVTVDGRTISQREPIVVPAGEVFRGRVTLDLPEPTFADCTVSFGANAEPFRTTVAVVRPPQIDKIAFDDAFYGLCTMKNPVTARRIGARFFRTFVYWRWTEKVSGQYDFSSYVEEARETSAAGLGSIWTFEPNVPAWLGVKHMVFLDQPEPLRHFANWVKAGLEALPRGSRGIEINNEPDITMGRTALVNEERAAVAAGTLLRTGFEVANSVEPGIPVLGGGGSGEATRTGGFSQQLLEAAHGKVDYYSGHPYSSSRYIDSAGSVVWPDQYLIPFLEGAAATAVQYTRKKALWSTELGWAYPKEDLYLSDSTRDYAAICAQALVLLKTVPHVGKIAWFRGYQYKLGLNERGYDYSVFLQTLGGMRPTTAVNAFATVSSLLEGSGVGQKLDLGPALRGYLFENPMTKQAIAALWTTRYDVSLKSRLPDGVQAVDLYGKSHPVDPTLRLTRGPTFFVAPLAGAAELRSALEKALWQPEQPFVITNIGARSTSTLDFTLESLLMEECDVEIALGAGIASHQARLKPGENTIEMPASGLLRQGNALNADVTISGNGAVVKGKLEKAIIPVPRLPKLPSVDGLLSPAKLALASQLLQERVNISPPDPAVAWRGPDDLSVRYGWAWNDSGLYGIWIVTDDIHTGATGTSFWNFDSLQIAFDPQSRGGVSGYRPGNREIDLALLSDGTTGVRQTYPLREDPPDIHALVTRDGDRTIYQVLVPWSYLYGRSAPPADDTLLGVSFAVNENDGSGRRCWMGPPGDGIGSGKMPARFPWLRLLPQTAQ
ncbi:MAG: hypothetical protein BGO12_12535 [Verrucomicrobia bacterium 61-8]|nr:MAG: hypothetical protein BGO12_12535 [Verrucomicrobia bacterium 61-8]